MSRNNRRGRNGIVIHIAVRMLIASYFLASAGLVENQAGANFLSGILPEEMAEAVATTIFYGTAFAIMIGRFVREAALVLAVFIFWSSYSDNMLSGEFLPLMALWKDMALVGTVLLLGLTLPGGTRGLRLLRARARPRRVSVAAANARRRSRPQSAPALPEAAALRADDPAPRDLYDADDEDDDNIFADLSAA